jgi:hypothetical protein
MPPFLPGVGTPLRGQVLDARTRLPIGHATVLSGLGWTGTDAQGRFELYGGLGSMEVSVSRIGYTAETRGGVKPEGGEDLLFYLEPVQSLAASGATRFLQVTGGYLGDVGQRPVAVVLGGRLFPVRNGTYLAEWQGQSYGRVMTTVWGYGALDASTASPLGEEGPFTFDKFFYEVQHWSLGDTLAQATRQRAIDLTRPGLPIRRLVCRYANNQTLTDVETTVSLDVGVAGSVMVARVLGAQEAIPVPDAPELRVAVAGEARDASRRRFSRVEVVTGDRNPVTLSFLGIPVIENPPAGASGVGARPVFRWRADAPPGASFEVSLQEEGEPGLKWVGRTSLNELTYPNFTPADPNGAALRGDKRYTWRLRLIDAPSVQSGGGPRPFRALQRESEVRGNGFTI